MNLIYNIKKKYNMSLKTLIRTSPRFGIMLVSMAISIVFLIVDVLSTVIHFGAVVGINPYWKVRLTPSSPVEPILHVLKSNMLLKLIL